jgi:GT2 family glycosyltransferase/ADP-heptose:LPS heptosyltransferase
MYKVVYPLNGVYPDEPADVSIVIPLYKSYQVCQEQILRWTSDDLKTEIVYVDDKCPQKSKLAVCKAWDKRRDKSKHTVKLVLSKKNLGFGGACNLGAFNSKGKNIIFLNADTIVTPNWVTPIIELLNDNKVGVVGNLQIKDGGEWHGSIDSAGSEWSWESMNFLHIGRHIYHGKLLEKPMFPEDAPRDILEVAEREMVTGCCFGIRKKLFLEIGGFNPCYRIGYWEDSELCMSVKSMGYKVMFQPESVIYHKLHHAGCGKHPFAELNKNYFFNKWVDTGRIDKFIQAKRSIKPVKVRNILVQRNAAYGDVILAAAVVPAIKKIHPNSKIFFSTECGKILRGNPYIDHIIKDSEIHNHIFQLRYNLNLAYERRPNTNILQAYADEIGIHLEDCKIFIDQEPVPLPEKFIVIHAGKTAWAGRDWYADRFDEIAKRLIKNHKIICVGQGGDYPVSCDRDLRDNTSMQQLAYIISKAKLFIGIDSLPMHIAQAVNTPGVCFFGCIKPTTRIVRNNMKGVVARDLSCLGCHQNKYWPSLATTECVNGTLNCQEMVSVDQMWKEIECMLSV